MQPDFNPTPTVIIAHPDPWYRSAVAWYLRQHEWNVTATATAAAAREWARRTRPSLALLATELEDESGFLTCVKLRREHPDLRVYLVTNDGTPASSGFAEFVGAECLFRREQGLRALMDQLCESQMGSPHG